MLAHSREDDDYIFTCNKRRRHRNKITKQIKRMRDNIDNKLCNILQKGLMPYFSGESVLDAMMKIKRQEGRTNSNRMGHDLLRGKFTKQQKIEQKAYISRRKMDYPALHAKKERKKKREEEQNKKGKKKN